MAHKIPIIKPKTGPFKKRPKGWKPPKIKEPKGKPTSFEKEILEKKYGGGKVKYRSLGGKVTNGNDITGMIYD